MNKVGEKNRPLIWGATAVVLGATAIGVMKGKGPGDHLVLVGAGFYLGVVACASWVRRRKRQRTVNIEYGRLVPRE
jgi:hypothetical protein